MRRARLVAAALALFAAQASASAQSEPDIVKHGEYLARAADCNACHTADPSKPFAGGYPVPTPVGVIYGTNLTPDKETGIGAWSDDQFVNAVQHGIGIHGGYLYPAMPYDAFTKMSREDVLAIKAYLMSLKPIHQQTPKNQLIFPFNFNQALWVWRLLNFDDHRFAPRVDKSPTWNRGAYLVEALAHCGACHTPRNLTMGMDSSHAYAGGFVGPWQAYNISSDRTSGVGGWSDDELLKYFSTGAAPGKAYAAGPMGEAVQHSLSHLSEQDLRAMIAYLRDLAPMKDSAQRPRYAWGAPSDSDADLRGRAGIVNAGNPAAGAELYSAACASCHGARGEGSADGYYPSMLHDTALGAPTADNLIMVILHGVIRDPRGQIFMPGFRDRLSDQEIAALANYLTKQFGNPALSVTPEDVARLRVGGVDWAAFAPAVGAGIGAVLVLLLIIAALVVALRRPRRRATA